MGALRPTGSRSYDPQLGPVSAVWSAPEGRTQRDGRSNPRAAALVTRLHSSPLNSPLHRLGRLWPGPVNGWFTIEHRGLIARLLSGAEGDGAHQPRREVSTQHRGGIDVQRVGRAPLKYLCAGLLQGPGCAW